MPRRTAISRLEALEAGHGGVERLWAVTVSAGRVVDAGTLAEFDAARAVAASPVANVAFCWGERAAVGNAVAWAPASALVAWRAAVGRDTQPE